MNEFMTLEQLQQWVKDTYLAKTDIESFFDRERQKTTEFRNSHDIYLRDMEQKLGMLIEKLNVTGDAFSSIMRYQSDLNERVQAQLSAQSDRINENAQAVIRLEDRNTTLYDAIFGNASRPDAHPSLMAVVREGFAESRQDRKVMAEQLETLQETVVYYQGMFTRINNAFGQTVTWMLKAWSGRVLALSAWGFVVARVTFPAEMDQIGEVLLILLGVKK